MSDLINSFKEIIRDKAIEANKVVLTLKRKNNLYGKL